MLKPIKDWVITKVVKDEEKVTEGGIYLPPSQTKTPTKIVEIVALGPEADEGEELKVGDKVIVLAKTGIKVKHNGEEFELAKALNFLGVIE